MARKYLDTTGLTALWAKITDKVTAVQAMLNSAVSTLSDAIAAKVSKSGDTMTGNLKLEGSSQPSVLFKESGYGDKFEIKPSFGGTDDTNYLALKTATGAAGTDPSTTERIRIRPSGLVEMTGNLKILGGELNLNTSDSSSNYSGDIVWRYGNGQEKARIWTGDNPTDYGESRLNFRSYKSDGSALHNTQLATASDVDAKLSKAGDTATGKITFNQGIAIKAGSGSNRPPFFISLLQSFADGGAVGYTNQSDMQYAIGVNGDDNHAASTGAALSSDTGKLGLHWYTQTGKIANQPARYGFLLTCANSKGSVEQHSIFMEQANGSLYHMGTNASSSGSPPAYKKIYDSGNLVTNAVSFTRSHASVSYQEGLVCNRFGNVVTFAGYFSCGATIAANTTLYSGLPKPAGGKHIYFTWSGSDFYLHGTDGSIRTNSQITPRTYVGTFTYVCA